MTNQKTTIDIQGLSDNRNIGINKVGICEVPFRSNIELGLEKIPIQGVANCYVYLEGDKKGTHMSRMVRGITKLIDNCISPTKLETTIRELQESLDSRQTYLELKTSAIRKKISPISGYIGYEDFKVNFYTSLGKFGLKIESEIEIIGTSLCPASKANSKYGAHSQRSLAKVKFIFNSDTNIAKYLELVEGQLSARVFPILKLDDEAYVTEHAYENPKFVEDIVRSIAYALTQHNLEYSQIECTNFESIHTHNAYAVIVK